ncbi:MAG: FMN-binding protein [Oscillospiraceae bacterium]|nr:FMN-binding protein [Oscillospiraceae bacterium]
MKQTYVMPLIVLTVICLVVSAALAVMDSLTAPIILAANAQRAAEAMTAKIPHATGFEAVDIESFDEMPRSIREVYNTTNNVGYIFIASANGFSGAITVICAIDNDGKIIATSTLSHTETIGIGTIIEQESFLGPFSNQDYNLHGIDTVTGATISTKAYIGIVKEIFEAFHLIIG